MSECDAKLVGVTAGAAVSILVGVLDVLPESVDQLNHGDLVLGDSRSPAVGRPFGE